MNNIDVNQYEFAETSRKNKIKSAIEAMLFVAGEPLNIKDIYTNLELDRKTVKEILNELAEDFKSESRGIKLINIDDSYQFVTKPENSEFIQKLLKKNKRQSLSQASIESLAIVAYKQPITISIIVATIAILIETLAPIQTLVNKSLPIPSLPNQNSEFGDKFFFDVTTVS